MNNRFDPESYHSIHDFLTRRFEPIEARIKQKLTFISDNVSKFFETTLRSFIVGIEPEILGARESIEKILESKTARRDKVQRRKDDLHEERQSCKPKLGKKEKMGYIALYLLLIFGAMVIFAYSFSFIMPEQNFFAGALSALILPGPSFMLFNMFRRAANKDRFLAILEKTGLFSCIAAIVFVGLSRVMAMLTAGSSGGFMTGSGGLSWFDALLPIFACVAYIAGTAAEITFGSRILIHIKPSSDSEKSAEQIDKELDKILPELKALEQECRHLAQTIAQIESFPSTAQSWADSTLAELIIWNAKAKTNARKALIRQVSDMPTVDLEALLNNEEEHNEIEDD